MAGHDEELRLCRKEIARLTEENGWLRVSSESFGALAERLNNRLRGLEGDEWPRVRALRERSSIKQSRPFNGYEPDAPST